tara:strand:+ start:136 stop:324 length:189 start_codon:yes stop_codon:yes gene_type:complete
MQNFINKLYKKMNIKFYKYMLNKNLFPVLPYFCIIFPNKIKAPNLIKQLVPIFPLNYNKIKL